MTMTRIAVLDNPMEADLLSQALEEEEIPFRVRSFHDTAYDGLFQAQRGWGELHGPSSQADFIRSLLTDLRSAGPVMK